MIDAFGRTGYEQLPTVLGRALLQGTWNLSKDAPEYEIQADSHLLDTAFLELIDNSIEAAEDREKVRLHVSLHEIVFLDRPFVQVRLADNGPGVPLEMKERIFEDFFTHRPGREPGLGLGLGFVRRVIEAHGGTIRESGEPGAGAVFLIEFPKSGASRRAN